MSTSIKGYQLIIITLPCQVLTFLQVATLNRVNQLKNFMIYNNILSFIIHNLAELQCHDLIIRRRKCAVTPSVEINTILNLHVQIKLVWYINPLTTTATTTKIACCLFHVTEFNLILRITYQ